MMVGLVAACSTPDPQAIDYKSTGKAPKAPSLAVPPDLLSDDQTRPVTPASGDAALSAYQASPGTRVATDQVLPPSQGLRIERDGSQRWLVVASSMPREQLWEQMRAFWQEQGFVLSEDSLQRGVMQTDWVESHAKLDQGLVRNTLSMAVDNSYVTGERNRFRTRIEAGPGGATYVFISQQGLHEVLTGMSNELSQWQPKPNDPGMEADYLGRMQRALARGPKRPVVGPGSMVAPKTVPAVAVPHAGVGGDVAAPVLPAGASPAADGISLAEDYDHAWARVGQALDRGSFTVESRDRARGIYAIRYVDPNDLGTAAQGFWNQLFHGKKEKVANRYELNVRAVTANSTRLTVLNNQGQPDTSPLAVRIMRLVVGEMR